MGAQQQHGVSWVGWGGPTHYVVTPTRVEVELACDNTIWFVLTLLLSGHLMSTGHSMGPTLNGIRDNLNEFLVFRYRILYRTGKDKLKWI